MNGTSNSSAVPAVILRTGQASASWSLVRTLDTLLLWHERIKSRRVLASLDDRMLRDIGMDHATARRESGAPFWR